MRSEGFRTSGQLDLAGLRPVTGPDARGAACSDGVSGYAAPGAEAVREVARCHCGYFGSRLKEAVDQR